MRWALWTVVGLFAVVLVLGGGLVALARYDVGRWTHRYAPDWEVGKLPCAIQVTGHSWLLISFRATKTSYAPATAVFGWRLHPWRHAWGF